MTEAGTAEPVLKEVDILARDIMAAREKALADKIRQPSKREIMWFSDVHACARRNYYAMAEGDQRTMWNANVQAKMDAGVQWEAIIKRDLSVLGYEPCLTQKTVEITRGGRVLARGKMDLGLEYKPTRKIYPTEVKCVQTFMFDALDRWQDFMLNPWTTKYVRQLMLYMYGENVDQGLFLLCDFQGHWKLIPVYLDLDFVEQTLKLIETAMDARSAGQPPDRIQYSPMLCGRCDFAHVCIPNINAIPAKKIEGSDELSALLERRDEIIEKGRELDKIERVIKKFFTDIRDGVFTVGNFVITRTNRPRMSYAYPDDVKAKYGAKKDTFMNEIERFQKPDPETIYLKAGRIIRMIDDE